MPISGTSTTGDDIFTVTPGDAVSVDGQAGTDRLVIDWGSLSSDIVQEYVANGWYRFTDGYRSTVSFYSIERFDVTGGSGDDYLVGADLADSLAGGGGNDQLRGGLGADVIAGGSGTDRWLADYSALLTGVQLALQTTGTASIAATGATVGGIEQLTLTTGSGNDRIDSGAFAGNDVVATGAGNDVADLGRGQDSFDAGGDTDTMILDWSAIGNAAQGMVNSYVANGWYRYASASGDRIDYYGVERFNLTGGAGDDGLNGGALNDTLVGNAGNDWLNGGAGVDVIKGSSGTDGWQLDNSARTQKSVVDLVGQTTNFGATLSGIERLHYTGSAAVDVVTALAGVMNDVINTGEGNDIVTTGRGQDQTDGGGGNDRLVVDWSGITDPTQGIATSYVANGWWQLVSASGDRVQFVNFEDYVLTGGAGHDTLLGGNGFDTLLGGDGDDVLNSYKGQGRIDGGAGNDRWQGDLSDRTASVVFDAVSSQTAAQLGGLGLPVTGIEALSLTTGIGKDNLSTSGFALNDWLSTGAGNDTLKAGLGFDTVDGGADIDLLVVDYSSASRSVTSAYVANGWNRYAMADGSNAVDYYGIERFNITGGAAQDSLIGGELNDTLLGNGGNDTLNGAGGTDAIDGGAGRDTYVGSYGGLNVALGLTMTAAGAGKITGTGTTLTGIESVSLTTGTGADQIDLGALQGDDTINSGDGNDLVNLGRGHAEVADGSAGADDVLIADFGLAAAGVKMAYAYNGWYRAQAVQGDYDLWLTGFERVNLTGSARNDSFFGFGGQDTLNGAGGRDILDGGAGDDLLTGGAGADVFVFSAVGSAGVDHITDAASGDILRFHFTIASLQAGNGAGLLAGEAAVETLGGTSWLRIGLDGTAGGDFALQLDGSFTPGALQIAGGDILVL